VTPTTVTLSRCPDYNVSIRKDGYEPASVLLSRTLSGTDTLIFLADSLLLVPGIVDAYNCSPISLMPNPVAVQLFEEKAAAQPVAPALGSAALQASPASTAAQ